MLTFCVEDNYLAFFHETMRLGLGLHLTGVVAIFGRVSHADIRLWAGDVHIVFVVGELYGGVVDPLGNINGDGASKLESIPIEYVQGLDSQLWLWEEFCGSRTAGVNLQHVCRELFRRKANVRK